MLLEILAVADHMVLEILVVVHRIVRETLVARHRNVLGSFVELEEHRLYREILAVPRRMVLGGLAAVPGSHMAPWKAHLHPKHSNGREGLSTVPAVLPGPSGNQTA